MLVVNIYSYIASFRLNACSYVCYMLQGLARTAHRQRPELGADYSYDPEGLYTHLTVCQAIDMN